MIKKLRDFFGPLWGLKLILPCVLLGVALAPGWVPREVYAVCAVKPMRLPHGDSLVIAAGAEELARGGDPLVSNPGDPWGRRLNYPRFVGELARAAGLDLARAGVLAAIIGVVFAGGVGCLLRGQAGGVTLVVAALLLSPPVLLGLERANLDLLIFGFLACACFLAPRMVPLALVPLCALKLFPVFGLAGVLASGRRRADWLCWGLAAAGCAGVVWVLLPDLLLIRSGTPYAVLRSWGVATLPLRIDAREWLPVVRAAAGLVFLVAAGLGAWGRIKSTTKPEGGNGGTWIPSLPATVGAGIFAGAYFLGTNFDYRLVFLLLVVPSILALTKGTRRDRSLGLTAILLVWLTFWGDAIATHGMGTPLWLFDETAPVAVLAVCGAIIGRALPAPSSGLTAL